MGKSGASPPKGEMLSLLAMYLDVEVPPAVPSAPPEPPPPEPPPVIVPSKIEIVAQVQDDALVFTSADLSFSGDLPVTPALPVEAAPKVPAPAAVEDMLAAFLGSVAPTALADPPPVVVAREPEPEPELPAPEPVPVPLAVDALAPEPEPPAPPVTADDLAVFDAYPGLHATARGIVRVTDPVQLLGLYLSSIRHGVLMLHGGPAGAVGETVTIKLAGQRVVPVNVEITGRIENWVLVSISDASEVLRLIRDLGPEWQPAVERLAAARPQSVAPGRPPSLAPARGHSLVPSKVEAAKVETVDLAPPPIIFDEPGSPQPGRLNLDTVVFRGPKDLAHEIQFNLASGGLVAASSPLPIRTHKSLRVMLGDIDVGVRIEADVVYAGAGLVGFAVASRAEVAAALQKVVKTYVIAESAPAASADAATPTRAPEARKIAGKISAPFSRGELLTLPERSLASEVGADASPLLVLDLIARKRMKGVLRFQRKAESVSLYIHEGSVAFVKPEPWNESHALGTLLVQKKHITLGQMRDALERAQKSKKQLGKIAVAMRLIDANALVQVLRDQGRVQIAPVFGWSSGTFELLPWEEPPVSADLVLTSAQSIEVKFLREHVGEASEPELAAALAPYLSRVVELTGEIQPASPALGLDVKQQRFYQNWIDGQREIAEIIASSPIGKTAVAQLIAFGLATNVLRLAK